MLNQWAAFALLTGYLIAFALGTTRAARLKGGRVWLFGQARGRDRLAALGFRASFALALLARLISPSAGTPALWLAGLGVAALGALIALVAQWQMGASWRVGVAHDESGALVTTGLFRLSRNPTFVGQALLLAGVALAQPTVLGLLAVCLFIASAQTQILREEEVLRSHHGPDFAHWFAQTPRWIGLPRRTLAGRSPPPKAMPPARRLGQGHARGAFGMQSAREPKRPSARFR